MNKLAEDILIEAENIERTLEVLREAVQRRDKTVVELSAIGACMHHCYSGMENIVKRIFKLKQISIPNSSSSHRDLLVEAAQKDIISRGYPFITCPRYFG